MAIQTRTQHLGEAIWPENRRTIHRVVGCRACGRGNRVSVSVAVVEPERVRCGACEQSLFLDRKTPLTDLDSIAYQHSLDRRTLAALKSVPGVPQMTRKLLEHIGDQTAWIQFMSDAVLCSEDQFPQLLGLLERARQSLDIPFRPALFLGESPHMNALTTGVDKPVIVVRSALLDQLGDDEIVSVLGHELGHLHADHPLYQTVAHTLLQGGAMASRLVRLLGMPIRRALLRWSRCAELTADRAALLASRDLGACIGTMVTFAGGNRPGTSRRTQLQLGPFIRQCRELAKVEASQTIGRALGNYLAMDRTHPHVAWRVMHLLQWAEHGTYLEIISGNYARRQQPVHLGNDARRHRGVQPRGVAHHGDRPRGADERRRAAAKRGGNGNAS